MLPKQYFGFIFENTLPFSEKVSGIGQHSEIPFTCFFLIYSTFFGLRQQKLAEIFFQDYFSKLNLPAHATAA